MTRIPPPSEWSERCEGRREARQCRPGSRRSILDSSDILPHKRRAAGEPIQRVLCVLRNARGSSETLHAQREKLAQRLHEAPQLVGHRLREISREISESLLHLLQPVFTDSAFGCALHTPLNTSAGCGRSPCPRKKPSQFHAPRERLAPWRWRAARARPESRAHRAHLLPEGMPDIRRLAPAREASPRTIDP